ncbi:30S ribosomal protein S8 [Patescibacteria group bacterium]|nr:30S ribosomal protein S8 [Patescibacteria group bacterium]
MVTDRVGDFIIRLQNAAMIGKREIVMPYSNHLFAIAKKLKEIGFLETVAAESKDEARKTFVATLAYDERGTAKLRGVKRISSPGRRLYTPAASAHAVKGGTGARLISSPAGIITDREARKTHVGGEDLFEIW